MDRIRQSKRISASDDLILTGQVVWVGNSSLDVLMEIHRQKDIKEIKNHVNNIENENKNENENESGAVLIQENIPSRLLSSLFTYVARDKQTGKACPINHFIPQGQDEENLFKKRETLAQSRKAAKRKISSELSGSSGNADAVGAHNVLLSLVERGSAMEDMPALASFNSVLMRYTALENVLVCQPQNVNTAGRVFGGYLSKIFLLLLFTLLIDYIINLSSPVPAPPPLLLFL